MENTKVILTVPHAICPKDISKSVHKCDLIAKEAAYCLRDSSLLIEKNKITILEPLIPKDTDRTVCDLNRFWCDPEKKEKRARDHPFRRKLRELVEENKSKIKFVLDIHSYPENIDNKWRFYDLVLIVDNPAFYAEDFVSFMNEMNIETLLQKGKGNDIHVEMRTVFNLKSMLIEFNEKFLNKKKELELICSFIILWLNKE